MFNILRINLCFFIISNVGATENFIILLKIFSIPYNIFQIRVRGDTLKEGDVILSNHPKAGGSHLPDLTVITPVFEKYERFAYWF